MKCPICKSRMIFENDVEKSKTMWYLCDCWYCKLVHHPLTKILLLLDKRWLKIHKRNKKTKHSKSG